MAVLGSKLYLLEYHSKYNVSILYGAISTNPFSIISYTRGVLAQGSGEVRQLYIYHPGIVRNGK